MLLFRDSSQHINLTSSGPTQSSTNLETAPSHTDQDQDISEDVSETASDIFADNLIMFCSQIIGKLDVSSTDFFLIHLPSKFNRIFLNSLAFKFYWEGRWHKRNSIKHWLTASFNPIIFTTISLLRWLQVLIFIVLAARSPKLFSDKLPALRCKDIASSKSVTTGAIIINMAVQNQTVRMEFILKWKPTHKWCFAGKWWTLHTTEL